MKYLWAVISCGFLLISTTVFAQTVVQKPPTTTTYNSSSPPNNSAGTTNVPLYSAPNGAAYFDLLDSLPAGTNEIGLVGQYGAPWSFSLSGTPSVSVSNFPSSQAVTGTFWPYTLGQQSVANGVPITLSASQLSALTPATSISISNFPSIQAVTGTFWQTTQPISASTLPLPTGAATSANQTTANASLSTIATNTTGAALDSHLTNVQSAAGTGATTLIGIQGNASGIAVPISASTLPLPTGASTASNQSTEITSLATIATNSGNGASAANQTNGNQQTKITNGTNIQDVVSGDTGFNGAAITEGTKSYTFSTTTTGNDVIGPYNCEGYNHVDIVFTSTGTLAATAGKYCQTSGGTFVSVADFQSMSTTNTAANGLSNGSNTYYTEATHDNYFEITGTLSAGTWAGTITFSNKDTFNQVIGSVQAGTYTVQPGNTSNTTPWLMELGGYSYSHISTNTTTVVKSSAGVLHTITINTAGATDTCTIYDNTAGSGTVVGVINDATAAGTTLHYDCSNLTGITIVTAGTTAPDLTVTYR